MKRHAHKGLFLTGLVLASGLVATSALAQYNGPGASAKVTSVAEILAKPVDNTYVVLKGKLVKQIGAEKYLFSDGNGEIRVEIDAEDMPNTPVNENTLIEIRGEVDKDYMKAVEIDVDSVVVITR